MWIKDLLEHTWYVQEITIINIKNAVFRESADINKINEKALFHGTNADLRSDNYKSLLQRDIAGIGTIDNTLIIQVW